MISNDIDYYAQLKKYFTSHVEIDDVQLNNFCSKFKIKKTKRNEILLQAGEIASNIYFVNTGCIRVYMMNDNGKESTRFLIFENGIGTAFPSFTTQQPSLAFIQSVEPSELLYINYHDFKQLLDSCPGWERVYRINLEKEYIASIIRIESLITMDAKHQYNFLLATYPTIIQRLPSKIVADYLGISQETLSRLKSKK